jgi:transposase
MANTPFLLPALPGKRLLELQRLLRAENTPASVFRRCRLIWELAAGCSLTEAARLARLHYTNAHMWVKRFETGGVTALSGRHRPGRPRVYGKAIETRIIRVATSRPTDLGLGFTTWSLAKLGEHLRSRKGLEALSRETIRRVLHRHGLRFLTGQTWCESDDPDFEVKKTR